MIRLLYDGSFDGLLCALAAALKQPQGQEISLEPSAEAQISFGDRLEYIETGADLSSKVYLRIEERFGEEILKDFYSAFLFPGSEDLILQYLRLLICSQRPSGVLSHPALRELEKRILRIRREVHRYKGFLRFRRLDGEMFYADYAPAFDITSLLMPHFTRRFPDQKLIIHDIGRSFAGIYDGRRVLYTELSSKPFPPSFSQEESALLWKQYLHHLSIEERANPRLQQNLMPKKYRKYITEMK
ncbi:MAG: TIGR03915 family putative DNA repair protein [Peptostreptococcaceae bacterium]|nr:TIGR03915 family putative DNA repair protein [Peptostreptococcaceae bacterium]